MLEEGRTILLEALRCSEGTLLRLDFDRDRWLRREELYQIEPVQRQINVVLERNRIVQYFLERGGAGAA